MTQPKQDAVKVKFLREVDVELQDSSIDEDSRRTSYTACECMKCLWQFIGDCQRFGYGYTSEGVQIPNYCPMCGSKFEDELLEDEGGS